jgi:DNA mismatch endonuclease (patch repair protein)
MSLSPLKPNMMWNRMSDRRTRAASLRRSAIMRSVHSGSTRPEVQTRRILRLLGYHYKLNAENLPGKPDIVITSKKVVIFVNGCFWHGHSCKRGDRKPVSNAVYWENKIARNKARDISNRRRLRKVGWQVVTIWECRLRNEQSVEKRLLRLLRN